MIGIYVQNFLCLVVDNIWAVEFYGFFLSLWINSWQGFQNTFPLGPYYINLNWISKTYPGWLGFYFIYFIILRFLFYFWSIFFCFFQVGFDEITGYYNCDKHLSQKFVRQSTIFWAFEFTDFSLKKSTMTRLKIFIFYFSSIFTPSPTTSMGEDPKHVLIQCSNLSGVGKGGPGLG